jgi:hypothetical protein
MARVRWLVLLALAAACGGGASDAPAHPVRVTGTGGSDSAIGGSGGQINSGACEDGLTAPCVVYYGVYQDQLSCFHGFQFCHCGQWGPCVEETELSNVGGTCGGGGTAGGGGEGGDVASSGSGGAS